MKKIVLFITCIMYIQQSAALSWPSDWTMIKESGYGTIKNITQAAQDQMPKLSTTQKVMFVALGIIALPALYIWKSWWSKPTAPAAQNLNQQIDELINEIFNELKKTARNYIIKIEPDSNSSSYQIASYVKNNEKKEPVVQNKWINNISSKNNLDDIEKYIKKRIQNKHKERSTNSTLVKFEK